MALSALGIALGVALGYGVHLVNRAALSDVTAAVQASPAKPTSRFVATTGFRALYQDRAAPGFGGSALELDVGIPGTERTLRLTGIDILRAAILQPQLVLEDRYELLAPDRVFLSAAAAQTLGAEKGDTASFTSGQGTVRMKVAGVTSSLRGVAR
jgi:putative ABC transport system permease protein